jgi:AraC-like DNA-binding protein
MMLDHGEVSLARAAECLGVTPRTLQRRLTAANTSFSELYTDARRELAIRYVANSTRSLSTVAELLGFSSLSPFSRWFAAEFGTGAATYRRKRIKVH